MAAQLRPRQRRSPAGGDLAGLRSHGDRLLPLRAGRDQGHLHRERLDLGAALARGQGPRLGHRRVRDVARVDRRAQGPRLQARSPRRPLDRDPAPDRAGAARRRRPDRARRPLGLRRLRRAAGRRRHPLRLDHRRLRRPAARDPGAARSAASSSATRSPARSRRSPAASSAASCSATSTTPRTRAPRSTPTSS